jgi:hypothetical protein
MVLSTMPPEQRVGQDHEHNLTLQPTNQPTNTPTHQHTNQPTLLTPQQTQWRILEAMRDDERTEMIIRMSLPLRAEARSGLGAALWERTMDSVRAHSVFGAR